MPQPQPAPQSIPPIPPAAGQARGYPLATGDRVAVVIQRPQAQFLAATVDNAPVNEEIRIAFQRLNYDVSVGPATGDGTPDVAYKTVEVTSASYTSQLAPPALRPGIQIVGVTDAAGNPKGLVLS